MKRILIFIATLLVVLAPLSGCKKITIININSSPEDGSGSGSGSGDGSGSGSGTSDKPGDGVTPVPDAIDLGVVYNGKNVKWASFNLGASSPEQCGLYMTWGQIDENDYHFYSFPLGSSVTLPEERDAASVKLGGKWRMPVKEELDALLDQCNFEWDWIGTVRGAKVTSKKEGNTNSIFLPLGGYKNGVNHYNLNTYGSYWCSTIDRENYPDAYYVWFSLEYGRNVTSGNCSDSQMIRPVMTD